MLNDFNWFVENRERLYEEYGDSYIAIKNMAVIGVYSSYSDGVNEVSKPRNSERLLSNTVPQMNPATPNIFIHTLGI